MATGTETEFNNTFAQRDIFAADVRTIDGVLSSPGDVDFLSFQGLAAGTTYVAETVFLSNVLDAVFDTVIQRHDDTGAEIVGEGDDNGGELNLSRLQGTIGNSGVLNLSVFTNEFNAQQGAYRLQLSFTLTGTNGAELRAASNYAEAVFALAGNDTINALAGNDTIDAGEGDDVVNAGTGDDLVLGGAGNDRLNGNAGNDTLDGSLGIDTLVGGIGNDLYILTTGTDQVIEAPGGGIDTVRSNFFNAVLTANVEHLELLSGGGNGAGNGLANRLTGNEAANVLTGLGGNDTLDGGGGIDTLNGGAGNDLYIITSGTDVVIEAAGGGIDTVRSSLAVTTLAANVERLELLPGGGGGTGNGLANTLIGNEAANVLDGLGGNDTMIGGGGADRYFVDSAGDVVIELPGGGFDEVISSVSFVLPAEVENLTLIGGALNGTGNDLNNLIIGNGADNLLLGLGGNDQIILAGEGNDTLDGGSGTDILNAGAGDDLLIGGTGDDTLRGEAGDDTLNGGAGNDRLLGFDGNNLLIGGDGNDLLFGEGGADTLIGGAGDDVLLGATGGGGNANVVIGGLGADTIRAANATSDRIVYQTAADSTAGARDSLGQPDIFDLIDLTAIDAVAGGGDDPFTLLGIFRGSPAAAFTAAGQLRVVFDGTSGLIQGNLDGNLATVELEIALEDSRGDFSAGNFLL